MYDVKALEVIGIERIKKESDTSGKVNDDKSQARTASNSFDITVSELLKLVNDKYRKYIPKNISKSMSERELGYHAGDLGKSESLGSQTGRDTRHFGTGTYFVGTPHCRDLISYEVRTHL